MQTFTSILGRGDIVDRQDVSSGANPLLWIGGWSVDPRLHPFDQNSRIARERTVFPVDLSGCKSSSDFVAVVERSLIDATALSQRADIAAWSMGALLAIDIAARFPSRVRRLLLIGATPRFTRDLSSDWTMGHSPAKLTSMKRRLPVERRSVHERFHRTMLMSNVPGESNQPNDIASLSDTGRRLIPGESVWSAEALLAGLEFLHTFDVRASVNSVEAPTMLVHGKDDVVCPIGAGKWVADHVRNGVLFELAGVGHVPFWKHDSWVGQRVEAFFLK